VPLSGSCSAITLLTKNYLISKYQIKDPLEDVAPTIHPMTQEIADMAPRYETSEPFTSVIDVTDLERLRLLEDNLRWLATWTVQ